VKWLALPFVVVVATAATGAPSQRFFLSPSRNISCELDAGKALGTHAYCQTFAPARSVTLSANGAMKTCAGVRCLGNPPEHAEPLAYGRSVVLGPFRCTSLRTGMRCVVSKTARGFLISRSRIWHVVHG
jgi:hypothetical protein